MAKPRKNKKECMGTQDFTVYETGKKKPGASVSYGLNNNKMNKSVQKIRKNQRKEHVHNDEGNNYHFDIWYIISCYIRPEDVGTFAAICKTSLEVVKTARFWTTLYNRHYRKECLPERYQAECLSRYFGLRTAVIKALHLMYLPFVEKSKNANLDQLIGKQCVSVSTRKSGKNFFHVLKFKMNRKLPFYRNCIKSDNVVEILNDIYANPDEDYCILEVVSKEFTPMPSCVIGQKLKKGTLTLSQGCCYHKLKLIFGTMCTNGSNEELIIDPVSQTMILNWWHPMYFLSYENSYQLKEQL